MSDASEMPKRHAAPFSSSEALQINAVLFDYGQVLSKGPNSTAWDRMRKMIGASSEVFTRAYWDARHDYDRGTLNGTAYWKDVAKSAGHAGLQETDLEELYRTDVDLWTDLNEPMVAWARDLQRRGIRTGILSNIGDRMETGILEKLDWICNFDHCTWSHRLNMAKPDLAIYQHAAEALATKPEHILFIDDRQDNIDGARKAGMVAVQYKTHEAFVEELRGMGLDDLL